MRKLWRSVNLYIGGVADALRLARHLERVTEPKVEWGYEVGV